MSLVGFKAQNHPQQTVRDAVDDRGTDPTFFALMDQRFGPFTVDAAASTLNAKCERFWTIEDNGLVQPWAGENVWCNPPYSDLRRWTFKAWSELSALVVMLLPANRTEQGWWQGLIEPYRDRGLGLSVEFLPGRMRFVKPGSEAIGPNERPPFGCCLVIWTPRESMPEDLPSLGGQQDLF